MLSKKLICFLMILICLPVFSAEFKFTAAGLYSHQVISVALADDDTFSLKEFVEAVARAFEKEPEDVVYIGGAYDGAETLAPGVIEGKVLYLSEKHDYKDDLRIPGSSMSAEGHVFFKSDMGQ